MANGSNGSGALTPLRVVGLCLLVAGAINTPVLFTLNQLSNDINDLEADLTARTMDRYYASDAQRDQQLNDQKFSNVYFRFQRNEEHISECLNFVRNHEKNSH